jgi:hypothetical protein
MTQGVWPDPKARPGTAEAAAFGFLSCAADSATEKSKPGRGY